MLKSELRKTYLAKRKALSQQECIKLDDLLLIQFQKMDWSDVFCVGSFYPMDAHNEPNTLLLTRYLKAVIPNLTIVYPRIDSSDNSMEFYEESESLIENKWGIQEPVPLSKVLPEQMDIILVPMLVFAKDGHRVGFGKGYYDRYFDKYAYTNPRVGISYFDPISKIEDTDQFDVPLTHCITPWNRYEF
jgi:5-formyltetrahydrofolate cyclo-ligase